MKVMPTNPINGLEPARTIFRLFAKGGEPIDGVHFIAGHVNRHWTSVYRWQMSKSQHGTGGAIPGRHFEALLALAERENVSLPWEILTGKRFRKKQALSSESKKGPRKRLPSFRKNHGMNHETR